jgi:hypothetical protein
MTPERAQDLESRLNNAESAEELIALLRQQ